MREPQIIQTLESLKKGERYVIEAVNPDATNLDKFYDSHIFTVARIKDGNVYVRFDDEIEECLREDQLINEYLLTEEIWSNIAVSKIEKYDENSLVA